MFLIAVLALGLFSCAGSKESWKTAKYEDLKFEVLRGWAYNLPDTDYFGDTYHFGFESGTATDGFLSIREDQIMNIHFLSSMEEVGEWLALNMGRFDNSLLKDTGFSESISKGKLVINDLQAYEVVSGEVLMKGGSYYSEKYLLVEKNVVVYILSFMGPRMTQDEAERFASYYEHVKNSVN